MVGDLPGKSLTYKNSTVIVGDQSVWIFLLICGEIRGIKRSIFVHINMIMSGIFRKCLSEKKTV